MISTAPKVLWCRDERVLHRRVTAGVVLLPPEQFDPVLVTGSGGAVWQLLAQPISLHDAAEVLADAYGADADVVLCDIERLIGDLSRLCAVREVDAP